MWEKIRYYERFNNNNDVKSLESRQFNVQYGTRYDILDYTTRVTTHGDVHATLEFVLRNGRPAANHAITQINIYGFGRKNEIVLKFSDQNYWAWRNVVHECNTVIISQVANLICK